jgi:hypothetical protein
MKDVLIYSMQNKTAPTKPTAPRPVRASATTNLSNLSISKLTPEQFKKFEEKIAKGAVYRAK